MAYADTFTRPNRVLATLINVMERMVENHPRTKALQALNALSDADLKARGTSRADEARRIVGPGRYL